MITNSNDISNYTYFKVNNLKDWELLKEAYNIHPLKMDIKNFPEIIIGGSSFDLEDKKIYYSISTYESFEMELDYILWYKLSTIQQDMINYWKSLGYKAVFEKYDFPKRDQRKKVEKNFYNGQHVWLVSDNTYLSELYLRSCDRPAYEILSKNKKKMEVKKNVLKPLQSFLKSGRKIYITGFDYDEMSYVLDIDDKYLNDFVGDYTVFDLMILDANTYIAQLNFSYFILRTWKSKYHCKEVKYSLEEKGLL